MRAKFWRNSMAAVKRVISLGVNYGISLSKLQGINNVAINVPAVSLLVNRSQSTEDGYNVKFYNSFSSRSSLHKKFDYRQISQMVKPDSKRAFLVDTLAMVIFLFCFSIFQFHGSKIWIYDSLYNNVICPNIYFDCYNKILL